MEIIQTDTPERLWVTPVVLLGAETPEAAWDVSNEPPEFDPEDAIEFVPASEVARLRDGIIAAVSELFVNPDHGKVIADLGALIAEKKAA